MNPPEHFVAHHLDYAHWGIEIIYQQDLKLVCSATHQLYTRAQWDYALISVRIRRLLEQENPPFTDIAGLAEERAKLAKMFSIRDLPYRMKKWIGQPFNDGGFDH